MQMDAPQLENIDGSVSNDGRVAQWTMRNRSGEQFSFTVSYRQIGYLSSSLQTTVRTMRERISTTKNAGAEEMIQALFLGHTVNSCLPANDAETGDLLLAIDTIEGGALSLRFPKKDIPNLLAQMLTATGGAKH